MYQEVCVLYIEKIFCDDFNYIFSSMIAYIII